MHRYSVDQREDVHAADDKNAVWTCIFEMHLHKLIKDYIIGGKFRFVNIAAYRLNTHNTHITAILTRRLTHRSPCQRVAHQHNVDKRRTEEYKLN